MSTPEYAPERVGDPGTVQAVRLLIRRQPLAFAGLIVILLVAAGAAAAPFVAPYDPLDVTLENMLQPPSFQHPLGTDELGRDMLSRIIFGGRISLIVAVGSVGISLFLGMVIGLAAGFRGGAVDTVLMRLMDAILSFPSLVLALAIAAALGTRLSNTILAIGIVYVPQFSRLVRGQVLAVRNLEYVQAAHGLGAKDTRVILHHILPNITTPLTVQVTLSMGYAILAEAALSFLGVGVQPPSPAWGTMLRTGYPYLEMAPWLALVPGAVIFVVVMSLNFVGDGIRNLFAGEMRIKSS